MAGINLDIILAFIGLTILASFIGVIFASKDQLSAYCAKYYERSYIMTYVAICFPIVFGQAERFQVKSRLVFQNDKKRHSIYIKTVSFHTT